MAANRTKTRRFNLVLQGFLALVIFLGLNLLGNEKLGPYRFDLSSDRLFTLSSGTGEVVAALERPVTLKFFFSESAAAEFPEFYRYGQRVEDFLNEISVLGGAKVTLQKVDPEPYSDEKAEADAFGLVNIGEGNENPFYLGLVGFDDTNRIEVVARFSEDRERFLEYDLAKVIYLLAQEKRPKLGIITGLPLQFGLGGAMAYLQGQSKPYLLYSQLGQFFDVQIFEGDFFEIPADIDALLILHPPALTNRPLYAIDQFVLSGKPALVFVDPFSETAPLSQQSANQGFGETVAPSSDLAPLLQAWGVRYSPDQVVVDLLQGQRVEVTLQSGTTVEDYVHWLDIKGSSLNPNDPVTASLSGINFASAGALFKVPGSMVTFEPLLTTSETSDLLDAQWVRGDYDASRLIGEADPDGSYTLSARVSGPVKSAFPDGVDDKTGLKEGDIHIIVTADADIFEDRFWAAFRRDATGQNVLVPVADNAAFVVNAIDHLSGSEGLLSLRARGVSKRPLEKFQDLRRAATRAQEAEQENLRKRLAEVQTRLAVLEAGGRGDEAGQDTGLRDLKNQVRMLQRTLNQNQRELRVKIRDLENRVIFLNMFLIPLTLLVLGFVVQVVRRRRP